MSACPHYCAIVLGYGDIYIPCFKSRLFAGGTSFPLSHGAYSEIDMLLSLGPVTERVRYCHLGHS